MPVLAEAPAATCWETLADQALAGQELSTADALAILNCADEDILALLHAGYRIRRHYFGRQIKLNMLINAKSGHCPEDCNYCAQSKVSSAPLETYNIMERETIVAGARRAYEAGASTYCIVCSGRGPSPRVMDHVVDAVRQIKAEMPLRICACLGILNDEQAQRLRAAGVDRYNHNLNTSENRYGEVCTTHSFQDRVQTVQKAQAAGISACSGIIVGMGETQHDLIDVARALRKLGADSIPVNLLHPVKGTPMGDRPQVSAMYGLKVLAMIRFLCPDREIRVAGGREVNLRSLQPLALFVANSIFVGDYLTTDGQAISADHQMIEDLGFEIERPGTR
jgi:biotin synthase